MEDNIMANIRKPRVPKEEQLKLINECRSSGMTDIDWCREHGIAVSTFYYWVKQLRKESAQIPEPAYGHSDNPRPRQDVVPIDIIPEHFPLQYNNPSPDTYANFASSVCVFRLHRCEHIASSVYGYGSSV